MVTSDPHLLRYGSVCSGIEAVTLAWQPLGLQAAWFSEIDPFACALLAYRYPQVFNLGDMTGIAREVRRGAVAAPDILVGGTPCQSFSVAGHRAGLDDPRGALTLKYVELANAIDNVRSEAEQAACLVVWENVPGVLSDQDNAFGCFLGALVGESRALRPAGRTWTNAGCVYGPQRSAAWRVLDAQYFGVAQRRKRVFVVASARTEFDPAAVLFERESLHRYPPARAPQRQDTAFAAAQSARTPSASSSPEIREGASAPLSVCFGGGNREAIEHAACLTARGARMDFNTETFVAQTISGAISHALTRAHSVTENGHGRGLPIVVTPHSDSNHGWPEKYAPLTLAFAQNSRGELRFENGDGQVTGALSAGGGIPGQGMPVALSVSLRGRATGAVAELGDSIASTLRASQGGSDKAHALQASSEVHLQCALQPATQSADGMRFARWHVRRLMPVECERLQGMPDHYTQIPFRGAPASDGPRYAAIGNSMAVPCMRWLGTRLVTALGGADAGTR
jgi:DNA (cytosine-5)-methyltransferase 1